MRLAAVLSVLVVLGGCREADKAPPPVEPGLVQYVLEEVPSDVKHKTLLDFQGKAHLIGYDLEPEGIVKPGTKFKLRMYWQSVSRLPPGWSLFTHLVGPNGRRLEKGGLDDVGPLRTRPSPTSPDAGAPPQALPPSDWQPGKVYVDEQELELPDNVRVPEVSVMVGIWRLPNLRLSVIGGPSDKEERGIVVTLKTGVDWPEPGKKSEKTAEMTPENPPRPVRPVRPLPTEGQKP